MNDYSKWLAGVKRGSPLASYCSDDYGSTKMIFFGNDFRNVAEFIFKEFKVSHFFIMIRDFPVHGGLFKKSFQGFVYLYSSTHLAV